MQRKIKMLSIMAVTLFLFAGLVSQIARADILEEVFKRTAYVDLQKIFQEYQKKKDLEVRLRQETETGQKKLEEMREELERLKKEYETQELLLTEEAKKERQEEITAKVKEVESLRQKISNQIKVRQDQYTQEIIQDIINKIKQIAEREGYIYVFDKAALVYAAPIQDITGLIIDELNKEYGAEKNE